MLGTNNFVRNVALITLVLFAVAGAAVAGTVTISSPSNSASVTSPFHLVAAASSASTITGIAVYVDGNKVASSSSSKIDTYISAGTGTKRVTVQGFAGGGTFSSTISVNVTGTSSSSSGTTAAKVYSSIEQMTGWESCTVCAGTAGQGDAAQYSMKAGVSSPSLDGSSTEFWLGGTNNYTNALWWKQLGGSSSARHFVYDLYFYLKSPTSAQALEFDVNQSTGGKKFIFGTECDIKASGTWRVWSAATSWVSTGIPCGTPAAYTWHHLIWEFERTTDNKVKFVAVTLNGKKSYVNRVYDPKSSSVSEINVAFQMDGDKYQTNYSTWLDSVKLSYW